MMASPSRPEGERHGLGEIVEQADTADGRRRQDRAAIGLVIERDIAGHDREIAAPGRPRRCRESQPTNCPMISGRSGLPKLRLSVMASGLAADRRRDCARLPPPPACRLRTDRPRNSAASRRDVSASAFGPSLMRTTAASPPGRCTVLPRMTWSYCSQTQRLEHRSGEPISFFKRVGDAHRRLQRRRIDHCRLRGVRDAAGRRAALRRRAP